MIPSSAVLMFHHVDNEPEIRKSGCLLNTKLFYEIINSHDNYSSLSEVIAHPGKQKITITFDDGLEDLYLIAYPYLKSKGIPFTAFIITDFLDTPGYITTEQLKALANDSLVTIGSHGITHEILPKLSSKDKMHELIDSQKLLADLIGKSVDVYAYSHGQYDKESLEYAKTYTYCMSVAGFPLNFITKRNRLLIPRFNVEDSTFEVVNERLKKIFGR